MTLRRVIAVVLMSSALTASAQPHPPPRYPRPPGPVAPAMIDAERAWREAEASPPRDGPERWRAAARAFDAVAADTRVAEAVRAEAAWTAVLAWKNALAIDPRVKSRDEHERFDEATTPMPLSIDDAGLVASLSRFLTLAPTSLDAPGVRFARANLLRRYHHDDEALIDLRELITKHLDHEVGIYAVNLALDLLNRARRYDEMLAMVAMVRADPRLKDTELAQRLRILQRQGLRFEAERAATAAERADDPAGYAQCAATYERAEALDARGPDSDELLYNAGVCWLHALEPDRAIAALSKILARKPASRLAAAARRMRARVLALQGDLAAAAIDRDAAARLDSGAIAVDDMLDAGRWWLALGDHPAVTRTARWLATNRKPALAADVLAASARWRLDAGDRRGARADLKVAQAITSHDLDTVALLARLAWDAACPVAPVDGLCRRGAKVVRDGALARPALAALERDRSPPAMAIRASAALEAALATRPLDRARVTAAIVEVTAIADGAEDVTATAAHAQLAIAAQALGEGAVATAAAEACATRARAHGLVEQHARCAPGRLPERRGPFAGAPLDLALEASLAEPPPPPAPAPP